MLRDFLAVIDRLIAYLKRGEALDLMLFDRIVRPLFQEFEPVAIEYIGMFRWANNRLKNGRASAASVVAEFTERRHTRLEARVKLREFASVLRLNAPNQEIQKFAEEVLSFFEDHRHPEFSRSKSEVVAETLELVVFEGEGAEDLNQLCLAVDQMVRHLEASWRWVANRYATLAIHLSGPARYRISRTGQSGG